MSVKDFDVVIVGGGLAGLSLALQLRLQLVDLSIAVVERQSHPVPEAAHKVGESLVELSTFYFSQVLGLKDHLDKAQLPKLGLRFFFDGENRGSGCERVFGEGVEFGAKVFPVSPSYQVDRGIFENFLGERCREQGVVFLDGYSVSDVDVGGVDVRHSVSVIERVSKVASVLSCKWVVDASSRFSLLKRKLGLVKKNGHFVNSAWFRVAERVDINDWASSEGWLEHHGEDNSRWFSTNHLMGEGYWVWLIPLSSGSTSIGIVADEVFHSLSEFNSIEKAMSWLRQHEPLCAEKVEPLLADKLQDFKCLKHFSHDCGQVFSKDRWFITGEAGAFLDPFYSPGSDMIAMSNSLICNVIAADFREESVDSLAFFSNLFYLNVHENTLRIYQGKYGLFGHPVVMPVKILWDFAVYWSFTAFLFIQGRFFEPGKLFALRKQFEEIGALNEVMQAFFVDWAAFKSVRCQPVYVDPFDFVFLKDLNLGLYADLSDSEFDVQFSSNLERLNSFFWDIREAALFFHPELMARYPHAEDYDEEGNEVLGLLKRMVVCD